MELHTPWVEKYRPQTIEDIAGHTEIKKRLKVYATESSMPHLLFAGPPGTGKTTAALALAKQLFAGQLDGNFLELNASDERGIDIVRNNIKDFARTMSLGDIPFKIIFLDEADALTNDAQSALRRTMEKYTRTCRFVLSCVSPSTNILLPNEVEMTMGDFEKNFKTGVLNVNENSLKNDTVLCYMKLDPKVLGKRTMRLTTMTGRRLDLTEDHPIYTKRGWVKAGELKLDDLVSVYPHLEGTPLPEDGLVVNENTLLNFLMNEEFENRNQRNSRYRTCTYAEKTKIKERVLELHYNRQKTLTKREHEVFQIIRISGKWILRSSIQAKQGISRSWLVSLIRSLERKGFIERKIDSKNSKAHSFRAMDLSASLIRNKADIRRAIESEFGISISYKAVSDVISKKKQILYGIEYTLADLKVHSLLPLTYKHKDIAVISRLAGFILGDGHITKNGRLIFTGDGESLQEIRNDIIELGFKPSNIMSKSLENKIAGRKFSGTTTWFYLDSRPLAAFFEYLGVVRGDKCLQEYGVPDWILSGPLLVKREFLRGLFGSEMHSPKCRKKSFDAIYFTQHKARHLSESAKAFFRQLIDLLAEFGVNGKLIMRNLEHKRKSGLEMSEFRIYLNSSNENLFLFFSKIGYAYSKEKERKGRYAAEYLRHKLYLINKRIEKSVLVSDLASNGHQSLRSIGRENDCSVDFVINSVNSVTPHLNRGFPSFDAWTERFSLEGSSLLWNKIESIEDLALRDVRDILCLQDHNFIANGILSHNCNYSSKIIEPLQSRCALFRFARMPEDVIEAQLEKISKLEGVTYDKEGLGAILYVSDGDMRHAINVLQATAAIAKNVTKEDVYNVASRAKPELVRHLMMLALEGKFMESRNILDDLLINRSISGEEVLLQMHKEIENLDVSNEKKLAVVNLIGEYNFRLVEGANEKIQLDALAAQMALIK